MPEIKQLPLYTQVLDKGSCVNETYCKTCDDEGHRFGDVWQTDPCTTCECTDRGSSCSTKTCPHLLICEEGYSLEEVSALTRIPVLDIFYHYLEMVAYEGSFDYSQKFEKWLVFTFYYLEQMYWSLQGSHRDRKATN